MILATGIAIRLFALSRSAVEHFDEGVYASNIYFGPPDYTYPQLRFYAPPLLPALIEAGMIAGLPPNLAALLPSFLAGCATIVALWWFGRSWFGPEVGLSAAAIAALSDFHVAYSTAALTDVLLGLWLILAVDAIARSLAATDFRWAIGAGIYTGLAWWTKYNGWLPLAIEAAALALLWLTLRPPARHLVAWLSCFAVTVIVACLVWSPYFLSLQASGGYAPIAANHAKYVVGPGGWINSAARQLANQVVLEGWMSKVGLLAALWLPAVMPPRKKRQQAVFAAMIAITAIAWLLPTVAIIVAAALAGIVRVALAKLRVQREWGERARRAIGYSLMIAWWCGLLLATPCYTPYPRLLLPWLIAGWLGAAAYWAEIWEADDAREVPSKVEWGLLGSMVAVLAVVGLLTVAANGRVKAKNVRSTQAFRGELAAIARQTRELVAGREPRAFYVFGEPALYFQLRAIGEELVMPIQALPRQAATIEGRPIATYLVAGPHANHDPMFRQQMATAQSQWRTVKEFDFRPSTVVWLDLHDPRAPMPNDLLTRTVRVYEFLP
jgi:dolichyl-phosphate-mannose-protein mannosyltransferase